jgi:Tfp pilus assembly protein PilX
VLTLTETFVLQSDSEETIVNQATADDIQFTEEDLKRLIAEGLESRLRANFATLLEPEEATAETVRQGFESLTDMGGDIVTVTMSTNGGVTWEGMRPSQIGVQQMLVRLKLGTTTFMGEMTPVKGGKVLVRSISVS